LLVKVRCAEQNPVGGARDLHGNPFRRHKPGPDLSCRASTKISCNTRHLGEHRRLDCRRSAPLPRKSRRRPPNSALYRGRQDASPPSTPRADVALVIAIVVMLRARSTGGGGTSGSGAAPHAPGPSGSEQVLAERYARGEIDEDEYTRRRSGVR